MLIKAGDRVLYKTGNTVAKAIVVYCTDMQAEVQEIESTHTVLVLLSDIVEVY